MNFYNLIGFPKEEVLEKIEKLNIKFKIVELNELKNFDVELFVKFEYINNILTLYFDKFKLNANKL